MFEQAPGRPVAGVDVGLHAFKVQRPEGMRQRQAHALARQALALPGRQQRITQLGPAVGAA